MEGTHANKTGTGAPVILQLRAPRKRQWGSRRGYCPSKRPRASAKTVTLLTWLPREIVRFLPGPPALAAKRDTLSPGLEPNPNGALTVAARPVPHALATDDATI